MPLARLNVIIGFLLCVPLFYLNILLPWSAVGVVILMGLITIAMTLKRRSDHLQDIADSLYFLGFIITLQSLFVAFFKFSNDSTSYESTQDAMLTLFKIIGSGLSTTITGLLMRELVMLVGGSYTRVDMSEVTSEDIELVVNKLNAALKLGEEAVEISQVAADSADKYRATFDSYSQMLSSYTQNLVDFEDNVARPLTEIRQDIGDTIKTVASELSAANRTIRDSNARAAETNNTLSELGSTLDNLKSTIPSSFGDMNNAVNANTREMSELTNSYSELSHILKHDSDQLVSISNSLPMLSEWLEKIHINYKQLTTIGNATASLEKTIVNFTNSVPDSFGGMQSAASKLSSQLEQLVTQYDQLLDLLKRDYDNLKLIAANLPSERVWKPMTLLADTMPGVRTEFRRTSQRLSETSKSLENASHTFANTQQVLNSLVNAIGKTTKTIRSRTTPTGKRTSTPRPIDNDVIVPGESPGIMTSIKKFLGFRK